MADAATAVLRRWTNAEVDPLTNGADGRERTIGQTAIGQLLSDLTKDYGFRALEQLRKSYLEALPEAHLVKRMYLSGGLPAPR
jgi:hypothetical protein